MALPSMLRKYLGDKIMTLKNIAAWGAMAAAISMTACGGESSPTEATNQAAQTTQQVSGNAASSANEEVAAPASNAALSTAPLDRQALLGVTSETIVETGPCPFLSDSTAIATADTSYDLIRREVSNEVCRWSKNAGFSVRVSVAPLATATPLKDRAYNIDTPPVLKDQPGPGTNAVILYDTAWDKELPYAMGFEQGDQLVEIFVTGLETDLARLTATAQEVAAKLPTAPTIEHQYREVQAALDYCTIWSTESLDALVGTTADESLRNAVYGKAGCKWDAGYGANAKSLSLGRYKQGDTNLDKILEMGGQTVANLGDRSVILTRPASDGYAGDSAIWVEVDDQQFNLTVSGTINDHDIVAKTLMQNLLARI